MTERALFLTPIYEPYVGGAAVHFDQLSRGLVEQRAIDSFVIVSAYAPEAPVYEPRQSGRVFRVLFSPSSIHDRWSKPKIAVNYLLATLFTIVSLLVFQTSVVHTHTKRYFTTPIRVAKRMGSKAVIDGQDLGAPSFSASGDVFIAVSENIADKATHRKEQVVQIPIGIDPEELKVDCNGVETPDEPYILFVGDIAERKGVPELLTAYERSPQDRELVVIGEHIERRIHLESVEGVQYLGSMAHREVLCYIREAELVVLPSKEEALGRVVLEAIFHQTPVLCPPVVPEFHRYLPERTISTVEAAEIREILEQSLNGELPPVDYPLEDHYVSHVIAEYASVYNSLNSDRRT